LPAHQLEKILGKCNRDGGHAAGLDHEKKHPSIKECDCWMKRLAKIGILTANDWQTGGQLRVNKAAEQRDQTTGDPSGQD
jgi:hypothetical protein